MTRVIRSADCGNSPKNAFVERLTIGIATRDAANGTIDYRRARTVGFCHVFEFATAKGASAARIVSYVVDV